MDALSGSPWSAQQLAEFLAAVSSYEDAVSTVRGGLELICEAFESEIGAAVFGGEVVEAIGYPRGRRPDDQILAGSRDELDALQVPGVGRCDLTVVPLEFAEGAGHLLLARSGDPFSREESSLLRAMVRVLSLTLGSLQVLAELRERQSLLERLTEIQRSISARAPLNEVLDEITAGASRLLGDDSAVLYFLGSPDETQMTAISASGVPVDPADVAQHRPTDLEVLTRAMRENRLVVVNDTDAEGGAVREAGSDVLTATMAAPVHDHSEVVGCLVIESRTEGRRYSAAESELLTFFVDHASLAVTDAKTVEALRSAADSAVHRALHDPLTGLANRTRFFDRLEHALSVRRSSERQVAVLYVDIDDFKQVNDRFGHATGDKLLVETAQRLVAAVQEGDTVARIGGDEFVVLIENVVGMTEAARAAERVLRSLAATVGEGATETVTSVSVGIASTVQEGLTADELLRNADVAMYQAKHTGKNRAVVFHPEMYDSLLQRIELESDMRRAVERNEFKVVFQPIVALDGEHTIGVEALARWQHPVRGDVPPLTFIPIAEETGLIVELGANVLAKACAVIGEWQLAHPEEPPLSLSVNISTFQLQRPEFANEVAAVLAAKGLDPSNLILEITESALMQDTEATLAQLRELTRRGVRLAIDDFGTGFSSLSYLHRFPVDVLKIDHSFVGSLRSGDVAVQKLTEAIIVLGNTLGLECVAEGVEHMEEVRLLRHLGCRLGQGYYFAPPLEESELARFLAEQPPNAASIRST